MTDFMDAWKISEKDFPHDGTAAEKLAFCVRYAVLSPSTYNTQPWFFAIRNDTLDLYADRRYGLPVTDPDDRGLEISCGAALYNLRLALRYFGYEENTVLRPDAADDDLMARVALVGPRKQDMRPDEKSMFSVLTRRHMNWGAFVDKAVPDPLRRTLESAVANHESVWLHVCTPEERTEILHILAEGDHIQSGDKHFRRELAAWITPRRAGGGDGIPTESARYSKVMSSLSPHILRRFEGHPNCAANDDQLESGAPLVLVLGSRKGGVMARIQVGETLMKLLLTAETQGLAASPLNQPCEVPELRLRLHDVLHQQGRAQYILRIGYGGKPVYTPRRPLEAVMRIEGKARRPELAVPAAGVLGRVRRLFSPN
ncbi:MAG: nitroreductase [Alphaproteobacteria bacterium]|nr:nitroreductase [Alphaproteobacteria bacterium]